MKRIYFVISILCVLSFQCKNAGETILFDVPKDSYAYFRYDSSHTLISKGWYKIEFMDSGKVSGTWYFEEVINSPNHGPQNGEGEFVGSYTDTSIAINLHPQYADNNIILNGKIDNQYIYGDWQWITFAGISNRGKFNSKKN
jgi:hypothetical protein